MKDKLYRVQLQINESRFHNVEMYVSTLSFDLTSDIENIFNNSHSHAEHLWQVLSKSLYRVKRSRYAK